MSDTVERTQSHEPVTCDEDSELMQAHAVSSTPRMGLAATVYVTVLYRCTRVACRRVKTVTREQVMPHP